MEHGLERGPAGVLLVGKDGRIRYVNPAFRRMVELRGEPNGRRPIEVIPVAEVQAAVDRALGGQEVTVACLSGSLDLDLQATRTEGGEVVVLAQDVTRLRQAARARTDFVTNVSHELRTPIASIMGYAETLLADDRLPKDDVPLVEALFRNGRRLRDIFEDLLELSRIEARRGDLPLQREILQPLLERALAPAADAASGRDQDFALDCPDDLAAWVNPEALTAIVSNLATNASAYTPSGGRIAVDARAEGDEVVVRVTDTGIGIDPAHHERIFERFYRVDEGRSRAAGGTGLGLAIVKHLALASGCKVTVESALGRGSVFAVHAPVGGARPVERRRSGLPSGDHHHHRGAIVAELERIRTLFLQMFVRAESMVRQATRSVVERDARLARDVVKIDADLDRLEVDLDSRCLHCLALRRPIGDDLRFVTSVMKVVTDLERIGDLAVNIAERGIELTTGAGVEPDAAFSQMADLAARMIRAAADAFVERDVTLARWLTAEDAQMDALNRASFEHWIAAMGAYPDQAERALAMTSLSKYLERVGDHAVNIGEMVIFLVEGEDVRHTG